MTDEEMWPINTRVKFNYDGLQAKGFIGCHNDYDNSVVVILDDDSSGWRVSFHCGGLYEGRRGWNVRYKYLQRCQTKLGNEL